MDAESPEGKARETLVSRMCRECCVFREGKVREDEEVQCKMQEAPEVNFDLESAAG